MEDEGLVGGRKRVALVYHYFAHYRGPVVRELCRQVDPDPEYELVSDRASNLPALICIDSELANLPVEEGGLRWRFVRNLWFGTNVLWQRGILRIAVSKRYDTIIYLGGVHFLSTWVAAVLSRLSGKHVLMWSHGLLKPDKGLRRFVREIFYRIPHDLLLYGHRAVDLLSDRGFDASRMHVVYNSLDYDEQLSAQENLPPEAGQQIRRELFEQHELPLLVFIGRVTLEKGLSLVLTALDQLRTERDLEMNLLIVGDGPGVEALRAEVDELDLGARIHFAGACYDETKIAAYLKAADLCVVPGPVGLTAIHALTYGTPVMTNDDLESQKPEFEAIVEGETGAYFRSGDAADLARKIADWVGDRPRARDEVARACRTMIDERFNPHVQVRIINEVIARGR